MRSTPSPVSERTRVHVTPLVRPDWRLCVKLFFHWPLLWQLLNNRSSASRATRLQSHRSMSIAQRLCSVSPTHFCSKHSTNCWVDSDSANGSSAVELWSALTTAFWRFMMRCFAGVLVTASGRSSAQEVAVFPRIPQHCGCNGHTCTARMW